MTNYTLKNLHDVEDLAVEGGFSDTQEARFADKDLDLEDEEVDVERLDAIRVGPEVTRGFEAGDDGLELIVFSEKAPGDAEIVEDFFSD